MLKATQPKRFRTLPHEIADSHSKTKRLHVIRIVLVVITVTVFWRVQNHKFVWDDGVNVERNQYLKPVTIQNVGRFWRGPFENLYVPLTYTAWSAIAYFAVIPAEKDRDAELDPRWFHIANVVLHTLTVLAVFALLRRMVANEWAAAAGAMLFALHPVQVEPVAWITGLKDVLSGFLSVLAIWQYFTFASQEPPPGRTPSQRFTLTHFALPGSLSYGFATAAFVLALFAKPAAVVVPLMAWIIDFYVLKRSVKQSAISLALWFFIALPFVVTTKLQQPDNLLTVVTPLWERPLVAADALAFYLYKLFFPVWFGPGYARSPDTIFEEGWAYFTWIIPAGVAIGLWCLRKRASWCVAAAGLFVAALLPVLGLVQFQFQNWSTVADRYLYLSMLGPAMAVGWLVSKQWSQRKWPALACAAVLLSLAMKSAYQTQIWHNSQTLWRYALDIGQDSAVVRSNLGATIVEANPDEAIYQLRRAVELAPAYADAYYNLGIALTQKGNFAEAVSQYRTVLKLKPNYPNVHFYLGVALAGSGQSDEAIRQYRQALQIDPDNATTHNNLGNVLADGGLIDQAIEQYREAVRIKPNFTGAFFNLGLAYEDRGDFDEAARQYGKALEIDDNANAHVNMGAILQRQGRSREAVEHFRAALRIKPDFPEAQRGLARALGESGNGKAPHN